MRKMTREVFLGVRFLVSLYFLLLSFSMDTPSKSTVVVLTAIYFSLGLVSYLKPERTKILNKLIDLVAVPPMIFLSEEPRNIFIIIPLIVMHTNRNVLSAGLLLFTGILLSAYMLSNEPITLFSSLILLVASPLSALVPDFISVIRKERDSMKNLRSSYRKLLQDFARWEKDRRELESVKFLLDVSLSSQNVQDFLKKVKERFKVKRIHLIPKKDMSDYSPMMDREKGLLSVPVKLEEGSAVIIFELESPFQLNDELVVSSLERAGRMVSLFVAGFEDNSSLGRAINIS